MDYAVKCVVCAIHRDGDTLAFAAGRQERRSSPWVTERWGFSAALAEVFPEILMQRCWVHKTANLLDKLPKSVQVSAKSMIHQIWQAYTRKNAHQALNRFCATCATYEAKYPKAADCLARDR